MLIDSSVVSVFLEMAKGGQYTYSEVVSLLFKECLLKIKTFLFSSISDILPLALTVAGAVLVVTLGWRLFRNFTRG